MSESQVASTGFVVLGAGLPRTGTTSLQVALQQLLGGKCYHMKEVFVAKGSGQCEFWEKALKRQNTKEDWINFFAVEFPCRSGVDYPISFYWKELLDIFPEAKVILSTRQPETWFKSVKESIYWTLQQVNKFPISWFLWLVGKDRNLRVPRDVLCAIPDGFDTSLFGAVEQGEAAAADFFRRWQEDVAATVPPERLLVFQAKEGWGPLCKFLGVPEPANPYPRVNDTASMRSVIHKVKIMSYATLLGFPAACITVAIYLGIV